MMDNVIFLLINQSQSYIVLNDLNPFVSNSPYGSSLNIETCVAFVALLVTVVLRQKPVDITSCVGRGSGKANFRLKTGA